MALCLTVSEAYLVRGRQTDFPALRWYYIIDSMSNEPKIQEWNYDDEPVSAGPLFHEASQHDQPTMMTEAERGDALARAVRERAELQAAQSRPSRTRIYLNVMALVLVILCIFVASYVALKGKR